jgi:autotransporter-associated beta strand protein
MYPALATRAFAALSIVVLTPAFAQTSWNSTSDGTWSTAANWTAGAPATGPQLAIYPGNATLQKALNLAGATGRVSIGLQFDLLAGGTGYTFSGTAGSVVGFFVRSGGTANGIINSDDSLQTFNVPIKLTSSTGIAGAGAAMTFNASAGSLLFNGNNNAPAAPWTINLNGASALTISGSFNTTIGSSGPGQIVNTNVGTFSGLIKDGSGTLTLGGTAANTYVGTNRINAGLVVAAKPSAFGAGNALIFAGGTFNSGGTNQVFGTLDLSGSATLDLSAGSSAVSFANSSAFNWASFSLTVSNWTSGSDTLRFGTDASGLTPAQLNQVIFADVEGSPTAQIDANGFLTPTVVPEPSSAVCFGFGMALLLLFRRRNR